MFFKVATNDDLGIEFIRKEIMLHPAFAAIINDPSLGMQSFRFIVLCYNYLSPFRNLKEKDRMAKCTEQIYHKKFVQELDCDKMRIAIDEYNELQFDSDFEEYYSIEESSTEIAQLIRDTEKTTENMEALEKMGKTLAIFNKLKSDLKEILFAKIKKPEDKMNMRAGKKLSFAERQFLDVQKEIKVN